MSLNLSIYFCKLGFLCRKLDVQVVSAGQVLATLDLTEIDAQVSFESKCFLFTWPEWFKAGTIIKTSGSLVSWWLTYVNILLLVHTHLWCCSAHNMFACGDSSSTGVCNHLMGTCGVLISITLKGQVQWSTITCTVVHKMYVCYYYY